MIDAKKFVSSKKSKTAIILAVCILYFFLIFLFNPENHFVFIPCYFYELTGFYCIGCGGLRAFHHLLHGNFYLAFIYNPMVYLVVPILIYFSSSNFLYLVGKKKLAEIPSSKFLIIVSVAIALLFWIFRNLPQFPFKPN